MDRSLDDDLRGMEDRTAVRPDLTVERVGRETPRPYAIAQLRALIDSAARGAPGFSQLADRLERAGVRVLPSLQKSGRLNGMSYEFDGGRYRGSELGRSYTAAGLQKGKGVRYDSEEDKARLQAAAARAQERPDRAIGRAADFRDRSVRARQYESLSESERVSLREVGRFRSILLEDLIAIRYQNDHARSSQDLSKLAEQGLLETRSVVIATQSRTHQKETRTLEVIVLTKKGKDLVRRFDKDARNSGQAVYAGFVKPREIAHDSAIYRMYRAEAAEIERAGGSIKRVVLDFELKKKAYSPLAKARAVSITEYHRKQNEIAEEHDLKVVGGKIRLPDLRIEYETAAGDAARVDLELATEHYRGDHMSAKERAGFKIYADSRSFPAGSSGRSSVFDDHEIEIFSF